MELLCDQIESIETEDGIVWTYITNNKITDQVFWDWEKLYKCVIS